MARKRNKAVEREIATTRIHELLDLAEAAAKDGRHHDAARYGEQAWNLKTRYQVTADPRLKAQLCRGCKSFLLPGETARTRVHGSKVTTTCLACGRKRRIPLRARTPAPGAETTPPP